MNKPKPEYVPPAFQTFLFVDLQVRGCVWHLHCVTLVRNEAKVLTLDAFHIRSMKPLHLQVAEYQQDWRNPGVVSALKENKRLELHLVKASEHEYAEWLLEIHDQIGQWDEEKERDDERE